MKEYHSVFASDAINLNLVKFTTGSLVRALSDQWDIGMPAHVSHDLTRLVGWARPTMVYFEPGLARLAGVANGGVKQAALSRCSLGGWVVHELT